MPNAITGIVMLPDSVGLTIGADESRRLVTMTYEASPGLVITAKLPVALVSEVTRAMLRAVEYINT